jgi:hypothetical protein
VTRRLAAVALCAATVAGPAAAAHAEGGVTMAAVGQPSWFQLTAKAGHRVTAQVRLTNAGDGPQRVRLAAADVGVAQTGGLSYGAGRPRDVGRWLRLSAHVVTLAAHAERVVPFTVVVPARTGGGDHFAGLTASVAVRPLRARSGRRAVTLRFVDRLAIAVRVRLPGARRAALRVGTAAVTLRGLSALTLPLANAGTALLERASLSFSVRRGGRRLFAVRQPLGPVVPHGRLRFTARWPAPPALGRYQLEGWIKAGGRKIRLHQTFAITAPKARRAAALSLAGRPLGPGHAPPWALVAGASLAAAGIGALGHAAIRRRASPARASR